MYVLKAIRFDIGPACFFVAFCFSLLYPGFSPESNILSIFALHSQIHEVISVEW